MKVLALVDAPDHVCCRYRIGAFGPALQAAGWELTLQPFARGIAGRLSQLAKTSQFDATIVQRKLLPCWQVKLLRRRARRLIFDFDDAVLFRDSYDPRGPHCPRRAARFAAVVGAADAVIAGNEFLAGCAARAGAERGGARIAVIPTCIDIDAYPPATRADARPGLDLVWIGSSSTLRGLELRRPLWERIGREVPGVRLRLICDRFPEFGPLPVVSVPWSQATEASALAAGDVGVSWIPDDLWSRGKCGLKVLQYQASGLPVLANPVGVHPAMVVHGETGFLVDTNDAWVEGIRALAADPVRRQRMGVAAREAVAAGYSVAAWESRFVAAVGGAVDGRPPHGAGRPSASIGSISAQHARQTARAGTARVGNS